MRGNRKWGRVKSEVPGRSGCCGVHRGGAESCPREIKNQEPGIRLILRESFILDNVQKYIHILTLVQKCLQCFGRANFRGCDLEHLFASGGG